MCAPCVRVRQAVVKIAFRHGKVREFLRDIVVENWVVERSWRQRMTWLNCDYRLTRGPPCEIDSLDLWGVRVVAELRRRRYGVIYVW